MPKYDYSSVDDCDDFGARISNAKLIDCLVNRINNLVGKGLLPGAAVGVVSGCEVELLDGYGVRDCSGNPVDVNTVYQLGELSQTLAVAYHAYKNSTFVAAEDFDNVVCFEDKLVSFSKLPNPPSDVFCNVTFADVYSHQTGFRKDADGAQQLAGYVADEILELIGNADSQALCDHVKPVQYWYEEALYRNLVARQNAYHHQATQALSTFWDTGDVQADLTAFAGALGLANTSWGQANYLGAANRGRGMINKSCKKDNIVWECLYDFFGDNLMGALGANSTITDLTSLAQALLGCAGSPFDKCIIDDMKRARIEMCEDLAMALGFKRRMILGRAVFLRSAILPTGSRAFIALDFCNQFAFTMLSSGLTAYPEALFIYTYYLFACKNGRKAYKIYKKWVRIFSKRLCCDFCIPDLPCYNGCESKCSEIKDCLEGKFCNDMFGSLVFTKNDNTGDVEVVYGPDSGPSVRTPVVVSFGKCDTFWFTWTDVNGMNQCVKGIAQRDFCKRWKAVNVYLNCKDITFNYVAKETKQPCVYACKKDCSSDYDDCWFDDHGYDCNKCCECKYTKCYGPDCTDDVCFDKCCDDVCGDKKCCKKPRYKKGYKKCKRKGCRGCDDCCYDSQYDDDCSDDCCGKRYGGRGYGRRGGCCSDDYNSCSSECKPCSGWPKMYWAYGSDSCCSSSCSSSDCYKKPCGKDRCQKYKSYSSECCNRCGYDDCCCDDCDRKFKGVSNWSQVVPAIPQNKTTGEIDAELSPTELCMKICVTICNLSEDPTAIAVFQGAIGVAGAAVKTLNPLSRRRRSSRWCSTTKWAAIDTTDPLTPVLIQAARDGLLYVEVETAGGAVTRGQIRMCK